MNLLRIVYRFVIKNWYIIAQVAYLFLNKKKGMDRTGLFTLEQENFITDVLLKFTKAKNAFVGFIIRYGVKFLIKGIDNFALDKIRQDWKKQLIPIIDAAIAGKAETVRGLTTDMLNSRIDIKGLDEEQELRLFDALTRFIAIAIDYYVQKQNIK